jgi:hypothetical protein
LGEKIVALTDLQQQHPITGRIAGAQVKRYLVRPEDRIRLHDLVHAETDRAYAGMDPALFHANPQADFAVEAPKRLHAYNALIDILLSIITTGCYWGDSQYSYLWHGVISRLGEPQGARSGATALIGFRQYPAAALMYAGGIASLLSGRLHNLGAVLKAPVASGSPDKSRIAAYQLNSQHIMSDDLLKLVPGLENRRTRHSDYFFGFLKGRLAGFSRADESYDFTFALFEYLTGVTAWLSARETNFQWAPIGRCRWSQPEMFNEDGPTSTANPRIAEIVPHLFSTIDQYRIAKTEYDDRVFRKIPGSY